MKIHFVCMGNVYRSRFAEAYARSLSDSEHEISSSGVVADTNYNGPISWGGMRIIFNNQLVQYMTDQWTLTTQQLLNEAELVVFMNQEVADYASEHLDVSQVHSQVWTVDDLWLEDQTGLSRLERDIEYLRQEDHAAELIKKFVDELLNSL